ncbi:MAG: DUF3987 domain-containing protein [Drouetiella hepatica Uher 2000/2452]|uniref:DUF3987 domain-containing protein n=1 Tax=Drouetiella hepatica Uher 2000/2452 TaxID=904376 RepID=A0A951QHI4_9CYAN|nr:DUF3987 domain-containing protein [Drouetiella hepatica Uher 2000/2452]
MVKTLPEEWALVAVGDKKAPLGTDWQNKPLALEDFRKATQAGMFESLSITSKEGQTFHPSVNWWYAIGVLCGKPSGGLLFVDHDGASCDGLVEQLSNQPIAQALPKTLVVTSGREGRYQAIYRVPEQFWDAIATRKIRTGTQDKDGKPEQLELRWDGCQSVVGGYHPLTHSYQWLPGQSPQECEVAETPKWLIERMLKDIPLHQPAQVKSNHHPASLLCTTRDWARSYLAAVPSAEDYDTWIQVGMALHSADENLLVDWDDWSRGATNYKPGECERHWKSFQPSRGIGLGTLGQLAKQNNWQSPFRESKSDRSAPTVTHSSNILVIPLPLQELEEDFEELAQEVQSFVHLTEEHVPVQDLLSLRLTVPLMHRAKQFNVPLESFVGILLPVAASLLKIGTQLEISASSEYRCPPILWTGLVGESGANKSPIFDSLLKPLEGLQAQADEIYKIEFTQYENELEDWQKCPKESRGNQPLFPVQREYYLQDATLEAIAACLSTQPDRGVVIPIDEFASFFNGFNQYRSGGRGNDRQKLLSAYDGKAVKVNRKAGSRISLTQTAISLTGTIQPCVLRKQMGDLNEVDGFWARFLWIQLPLTRMPAPGEGVSYDLSGLLRSLYQGLESLTPETYQFDQRGRAIWVDWHNYCEDQKLDEANPARRAIYPKSKERAARIALVVHCINAVVEDRIPERIIPSNLLESAIAFTKWSIGQTQLIYADAGAVSHEETSKIVRFIERFRNSSWITARNVTHWWSAKPKLKAEAARAFMKQVVDLGYAIDNGKTGKDYAIRIKGNADNSGNNPPESFDSLDTALGNKNGNSPVTTNGTNPELPTEQNFKIENSLASSLDSLSTGATTEHCSRNSSNGKDESPVDLLPDVIRIVTTPTSPPDQGSTGICYPVTDTVIQAGDRVVLTGEGSNRPPDELKAVWTVQAIQEQKAIVESETFERRVFPLMWLTLYE